jgi:hypothetical protein
VTAQGPYRRAAAGYRRLGWPNPIPVRGKDLPPAGYTGADGADVTDADVLRWSKGPEGTRNIALRLPDGIVGIDVDAHDGKRGADTLAQAEGALGQLRATWSSTSRGAEQPSRIYLYQVPAGLDWSHAEANLRRFGPNVDVLHQGHRYALVAPSEHPTTGKVYRWYPPGPMQPKRGIASGQAPAPADLAELPTAWVEFLTAPPNRPEPRPGRPVRLTRGTPWQAYNADTEIGTDLLAPAGWTFVYRKGHVEYWRRPGKLDSGHSASIGDGHDEDGNPALWLFTTSTEFEPGRYYDATGVFAVLHHHGERSAACKALYELGYGDRVEPPDDGWTWPTEDPGREVSERSEQRSPAPDLLSPSSLSSQWPTLDPAALYGIAGKVVKTLGPHTEADPAALLLTFLAAAGSIVGLGPHAIADAAAHPARLNVVLVGQTSRARKGTAWAQIRNLLALVDPSWTTGCVLPGIASGEALIAEVRDGTSDEDLGVADKRRLVLEPEFARLLAVAAREGSILSAVLREAWDGNVLKNRTKAFPQVATGAHISVVGHITREELLRRLTDTEAANGFANRFLFALVRRSKRLPEGGQLDPAVLDDLARQVGTAIERAYRVGILHRDGDARELWAKAYDDFGDGSDGLAGAITARPEAQTLRLSVAYAALDGSPVITAAHIEAGLAVWSYCEASALAVFGDALGDPIADRLLAALRDADDGLDGTAQSALFGRHASAVRLAQARALLEGKGLIVTTTEETGGRPRAVSKVVQR